MEKEDKLQEEFSNIRVFDDPFFENKFIEEKSPKDKQDKKKRLIREIVIGILILLAISLIWMVLVGGPNSSDLKDIELFPGQANVNLNKLNCDRFLTENNFNYENSLNIEADIIDHILCITKDIYQKYPSETEETFRKYDIRVVP